MVKDQIDIIMCLYMEGLETNLSEGLLVLATLKSVFIFFMQ